MNGELNISGSIVFLGTYCIRDVRMHSGNRGWKRRYTLETDSVRVYFDIVIDTIQT